MASHATGRSTSSRPPRDDNLFDKCSRTTELLVRLVGRCSLRCPSWSVSTRTTAWSCGETVGVTCQSARSSCSRYDREVILVRSRAVAARSAAGHQLTFPPHRRVTYGGRAFAVAGPSTWDSRLRDLPTAPLFSAVFSKHSGSGRLPRPLHFFG